MPDSNELVEADVVIIAFGFLPSPEPWFESHDIQVDASGKIQTTKQHHFGQTHNPKIFAAGDMVRGSDLVVTAVYEGRQTAEAILDYLDPAGQPIPDSEPRRRRATSALFGTFSGTSGVDSALVERITGITDDRTSRRSGAGSRSG